MLLTFVRQRGPSGATVAEIAAGLRIDVETARSRAMALHQAGQLIEIGRRPDARGDPLPVWVADFSGNIPASAAEGLAAMSPAASGDRSTINAPIPPHAAKSETSAAAAAAIAGAISRLQATVLDYVRKQGNRGATDEETAAGLRMQIDTTRARRVELRDLGVVRDSGTTRPTQHGRAAVVWIAEPGRTGIQRPEN